MNLFNFPIRRPVTVLMGMIMIVVLGSLSWYRMPLDLMPDISFPNLVIFIRYEGAGPEEIEERLGKPLESVIKTASNIKNVKVTSQEEMCFVQAEFAWGTDLDAASADIREKISMVRDVLPEEIEEPMVLRVDFQDMPVMFMHLDDPSGKRNLADLADIANDQVGPMLERLPGVASTMTLGGLYREIQVNVDQEKLKEYGLTITDVMKAIGYSNLDMDAGGIDVSPLRFRVRGENQYETVEQIRDQVVGFGASAAEMQKKELEKLSPYQDPLAGKASVSPIRLRDVAEVKDTFKDKNGLFRMVHHKKGVTEGVGLAVVKETDANMVEVAKTVTDALDDVRESLPGGVELGISFDLSEIITDSLSALGRAAVEGALLAMIVIFLFLLQFRPSLIVITSIPLSMLACFIAMYFSDYTLNMMTLGGMVIAIGKLVDDSIVVLENIYRRVGLGESPEVASERGFREVATAVISATLVAVIIFLPVAFTQGLSAQLFRTFAGTVFFALMASLLVSFTVVPMLSSKLLRPTAGKKPRMSRRVFEPLQNGYGRVLEWSLKNWGKVLIMAFLVLALTGEMIGLMYFQGRFEFVPRLIGNMYRAKIILPPGTMLEETDELMQRITKIHREKVPDYINFFMVMGESGDPARAAFTGGEQGTNEAEMNIRMKKKSQGRTTSEQELREIWDEIKRRNPNVEIAFQNAGSIDFTTEKPIQVKIYGDDLEVLEEIADRVKKRVEKVPGSRDVSTTIEEGVPEYLFSFNQEKLASYQLTVGEAMGAAKAAIGGTRASLFRKGGDEYDITVQLMEKDRDQIDEIRNVRISSPRGFQVPLRDVAGFEFGAGPNEIVRENSKRLVKVGSNKTERPMGDIVQDIEEVLKQVRATMPEGYSIEFGGEMEDLKDAFTALGIMFIAAVILVYLILASLYESLIHPITIMVAVPVAFTGAVAGLYITNVSFSITAFIGLIMLVGIVATNSIVLMDFIIEYHRSGMKREEAIVEAGKTRLRPILMTATTTMFGVVPIALGTAEGMELQQPLGIVMLGGLITSTLLTLVLIPVFYKLFEEFAEDMKNLFRRKTK
ncbi:MAG: efflux RND transporter permease subunit [bacterium]